MPRGEGAAVAQARDLEHHRSRPLRAQEVGVQRMGPHRRLDRRGGGVERLGDHQPTEDAVAEPVGGLGREAIVADRRRLEGVDQLAHVGRG